MRFIKYTIAMAAGFLLAGGFAYAASNYVRIRQVFANGIDVLGSVRGNRTDATMTITSTTADSTTSGSVASVTIAAGADIAATDLVLNVEDSSGNNRFTVAENGNSAVAGSMTVTGDGLFTGGATIGSSGTEIVKYISTVTAAIDIGTAGAGAAVTADAAVTGAALGDICLVAPLLDDAAWDEGGLSCFVEGSNDVKIVYHADGTGGDPASMTYRVTLIQH